MMGNLSMLAGSVLEEGGGCSMFVSSDAHVHIRVRILSAEEQPIHYIRGKCFGVL